MGMFDEVAKLVNAAGSGMGNGLPGNAALMGGLVKMLGTDGSGLTAIIQGFQKAGLGSIVASWVGTGPNLPISPEHVLKALGSDKVRELAQTSGLSESATATALAGLLPTVVNRLTPGGSQPEPQEFPQLLDSVRSMLG